MKPMLLRDATVILNRTLSAMCTCLAPTTQGEDGTMGFRMKQANDTQGTRFVYQLNVEIDYAYLSAFFF